eukprot:gene13462-15583_t
MDEFAAENMAHLAELTQRFDEAVAAVREGAPPLYTFVNTAYSPCPVDPEITMVTIITRPDEDSEWDPPAESPPAPVYDALLACGFSEEAENGFTISRPVEEVALLLASWGLVEVPMDDLM